MRAPSALGGEPWGLFQKGHVMSQWKGQPIQSMRNAHQGDPGFDQSKGEQIVITLKDGTEKTVLRSEVQS